MKANITSYLFLTILFISTFALPAPQRQRTSELGTTTRRPTRPVSSTTPANGGPESGVDIKEVRVNNHKIPYQQETLRNNRTLNSFSWNHT